MAILDDPGVATYSSWLRWRFELLMFYDRAVAEANRSMSTWDIQLTAWQVRQGSVDLVHSHGRLRAVAGDWMLIPPGLARRHLFSNDAAIRSIRCQVSDAAGQPAGLGLAPHVVAGGCETLRRAADALAQSLDPAIDWHAGSLSPVTWGTLQGAVIGWCASACARLGISGQTQPVDARVAAAQRLLLARHSPAALPWGRLREATGLSRPQLDRLFRQASGLSVRAWSEGRQLADACAALGDLAEPVKAVAARLGFGDASHFCRWFRQRTGASPADWRRRGGT